MKRAPYIAGGVLCVVLTMVSHLTADVSVDKPIKEADGCGFVQDMTGSVVAGATVNAINGVRTVASATTLSDGSFAFTESMNMPVQLEVSAKGFSRAVNTVGYMRTAGEKKCKHPVYVVLATGQGRSFITNKKSGLPRTK